MTKDQQSDSTARLHELRRQTETVATYLQGFTQRSLEVLRPALLPQRVLGRYVQHPGNTHVSGVDKNWAEFSAAFKKVAGKLRTISSELSSPLDPIDPVIQLHPWEYVHIASSKGNAQPVTIVCPTKWVVAYKSALSLNQFRNAVIGDADAQAGPVRQFVIHSLVMRFALESVKGLEELFDALRLSLSKTESPDVPGLEFATLHSKVSANLPDDDVVTSTTQLTGVPRFTELIDPNCVSTLTDPLRDELERMLSST